MKNILITGANRGIGLGLVKKLASEGVSTQILMTCRNLQKGQEALKKISEEKIRTQGIHLVQLDLMHPETFHIPTDFMHKNKKQLDVLVNNAAVNIFDDGKNFSAEKAETTLTNNFFNQIKLIEHFLNNQSIRSGGKIINVTSTVGNLRAIRNETVKTRLKNANSAEELVNIAHEYIEALKVGDLWQSKNAIVPEYAFGKLLFTIYTELLAKDERILENNIKVNSFCPGWVRTDMGGPTASLSVDEAAEVLADLVNLPPGIDVDTQGKLFSNKKYTSIR